jgi:surface antigen bspA-like
MEKIFNKKAKGITLIALVITIVIVLILAGISMSFVLGENGIITKAQEAREKTEEAKANEEKDFAGWTDSIDKILKDNENDDDDDYDNGMAKYFTYTVNEDAKEATITGVKDEYATWAYYSSEKGLASIVDEDKIIQEIIIPKKIEYNGKEYTVTQIGKRALAFGSHANSTSAITSLMMPNTIRIIDDESFKYQQITSIVWSENLKKIGANAFSYNNMETIDLPRSLEEIGEYAFFGNVCKEIKIRKNVKNIGYDAFCTGTDVVNVYCEATEKPENWNNSWVSGYVGGGFNVTINKYWNQTL